MFKKVVFILGIVLTILAAIAEATTLQLLPLVVVLFLMGLNIYGKKDLRVWILVISILMSILNAFVIFSAIDIIYWLLVVVAFAR